MAQNPSRSKHKLLWLILLPLVLLVLACCFGGLYILFPGETRAPEEFPDTDLVFVSSGGIGFVNADGSVPTYLDLSIKMYGGRFSGYSGSGLRPVLTADNHTLIVKVNAFHYRYMQNSDPLALWRTGEYPILCNLWGEQYMPLLTTDQSHIFIHTEQGMALYELNSCESDSAPIEVYEDVYGIPSPDLRYLVYINDSHNLANDPFIVIRNHVTGEEVTVGIGDYPAWSRDSQWLAYTGQDGIYIFNVTEDANPRRLVLYPNPVYTPGYQASPTYQAVNDYVPPEVSWSPDGQWLVYHRMITESNGLDLPSYNAIFKVNIDSKEELMVIDGGMYPYWRWPAQP